MLTCGVALAASAEEPSARQMTLAQCLELAAAGNPDLKLATDEVDAAAAGRWSAAGNFGPVFHLDASAQQWDQALGMQFMGITFPLRDKYTRSVSATVTQSITPLWTILEAYRLRDLGLDVAEIDRQTRRNDVTYQVTEAFYRTLQASGLREIAQKSVDQVSAQVARAHAFYDQSMVGENDVLRAELGLAAAKQRLIQARGNVILATGHLAALIGLPADTSLEPVADTSQMATPTAPAVEEIERSAVANRPELKELAARTDQARAAWRLAWSKMVPALVAMGNYSYSKGSQFQPERAWFVGGALSWDVWQWGATYFGTQEADARVRQALDVREKIENLIRLEAHGAHVTATSAAEALQVAESAVKQAEENFRIENKRYEAASSTTFDVLDAETLLTTARTQQQTALYDFIIARAAITRVMGGEAAVGVAQ